MRQKEVRAYRADNPGAPFFGISDYPEGQLASLREVVTATLFRPLPDSRVLGFKEVKGGQLA